MEHLAIAKRPLHAAPRRRRSEESVLGGEEGRLAREDVGVGSREGGGHKCIAPVFLYFSIRLSSTRGWPAASEHRARHRRRRPAR